MICLTGDWCESNIGIQITKKNQDDIHTSSIKDWDSYLHSSRPLSYL